MGKLVLAGIFTLAASASLAQTASTPDQAGAGGPANLCQELLAFMEAPPPEPAAATAATAKAAEAKPAQEAAAPQSKEAAAAKDVRARLGPGGSAAVQREELVLPGDSRAKRAGGRGARPELASRPPRRRARRTRRRSPA